jgi:flagellar assembly protein FliH
MTLVRGRVIRFEDLPDATTPVVRPKRNLPPRAKVVPSVLVDAEERARLLISDAERRARDMLESAALRAADVRLSAEAEGRADGIATVAGRAIALAALEAQADERQLDRVVELARLLAERLLGESLRLDPTRVVDLARQALKEARGARRVMIAAHPDDRELLANTLGELGLDSGASVTSDAALNRGNLRIQTEIGALDAELAPQLDRLARRLRESIRK